MIPLKRATQAAAEHVREIYPDADNILIEEIEMNPEQRWVITLSFLVPSEKGVGPFADWQPDRKRMYKIFTMDSESGEMISMKIREFQS